MCSHSQAHFRVATFAVRRPWDGRFLTVVNSWWVILSRDPSCERCTRGNGCIDQNAAEAHADRMHKLLLEQRQPSIGRGNYMRQRFGIPATLQATIDCRLCGSPKATQLLQLLRCPHPPPPLSPRAAINIY